MKKMKLLCSLILCYSRLAVEAAEPQEAPLEGILRQQTIRETLLPYVLPRNIGRLSCVSHALHKAVEPAIVTAMKEVALWKSCVLNARDLDLREQRKNYSDNQDFKHYVIWRIERFAINNPGTWIKLNLDGNNLGNDVEFLRDLLHAIATTVHSLKIDLASLALTGNQLESLPEHLFEGLDNLQYLSLGDNRLTILPEHIFESLNNLQILFLYTNQLANLPEHLFEGLNNLKILEL